MYDIIVVGGRCAGAATAMVAARAGCRVLVLDRARFPSDTLSTHLIHQPGVALLAKWGVLDAVVATGCPPIERSAYHVAGVHLHGTSQPAGGQRAAYAPRRYLLDQVLADAATEAGAEFRDRSAVSGLLVDGGEVHGVRYREADGSVHMERARLVVGADGMRSTVGRCAEAVHTVRNPTMTCVYYAYWKGLPAHFELHEAPGRFVGLIPTNDDLTVVAAYFPQSRFDDVRRDVRNAYLENIRSTVPYLRDLATEDGRFGKLFGSGDQQNFFRQASGPGWVLVGDAGHHKDSITAHGISDAFKQVELLATHVIPNIGNRAALGDSLATYGTLRDDALTESYYNTLSVARLAVSEDRIRLLREIERDQRLVDRYFSIVSGVASVEEVYTEEGLIEILMDA